MDPSVLDQDGPIWQVQSVLLSVSGTGSLLHAGAPFFRSHESGDATTLSASGVLLVPPSEPCTSRTGIETQPCGQHGIPQPMSGPVQTHALLLAPVSLLWPFLSDLGRARYNRLTPSMISPSTRLHAVLELPKVADTTANTAASTVSTSTTTTSTTTSSMTQRSSGSSSMCALPAHLLGSFCCDATSDVLRDMLLNVGSSSGADPDRSWQLGWALAPAAAATRPHSGSSSGGNADGHGGGSSCENGQGGDNGNAGGSGSGRKQGASVNWQQQQQLPRMPPPLPPKAHAAFAVLSVLLLPPQLLLHQDACVVSGGCAAGEPLFAGKPLRVVGSPFGCLSPSHFSSATVGGCVSTILPQSTSTSINNNDRENAGLGSSSGSSSVCGTPSLFAVDAVCFPGMEGGLVLPEQAHHHPPAASCSGNASMAPTGATQRQRQQLQQPLGVLLLPLSRRCDGVQVCVNV